MKKRIKIIVTVLIAVIGVYYSICHVDKLHLEKVPVLRTYLLGISKPCGIVASRYPYKITWDKLDERPSRQDYPWGYAWFDDINEYTRLQLKRYMKENNLCISSSNYNLDMADDYDDLMHKLIFEKLPENTD